MVLIETANSEGVTGRCDAKCYNAEHEKCRCCCGGANHGVGLKKALQNTAERIEEIENDGFTVAERTRQQVLFD